MKPLKFSLTLMFPRTLHAVLPLGSKWLCSQALSPAPPSPPLHSLFRVALYSDLPGGHAFVPRRSHTERLFFPAHTVPVTPPPWSFPCEHTALILLCSFSIPIPWPRYRHWALFLFFPVALRPLLLKPLLLHLIALPLHFFKQAWV